MRSSVHLRKLDDSVALSDLGYGFKLSPRQEFLCGYSNDSRSSSLVVVCVSQSSSCENESQLNECKTLHIDDVEDFTWFFSSSSDVLVSIHKDDTLQFHVFMWDDSDSLGNFPFVVSPKSNENSVVGSSVRISRPLISLEQQASTKDENVMKVVVSPLIRFVVTKHSLKLNALYRFTGIQYNESEKYDHSVTYLRENHLLVSLSPWMFVTLSRTRGSDLVVSSSLNTDSDVVVSCVSYCGKFLFALRKCGEMVVWDLDRCEEMHRVEMDQWLCSQVSGMKCSPGNTSLVLYLEKAGIFIITQLPRWVTLQVEEETSVGQDENDPISRFSSIHAGIVENSSRKMDSFVRKTRKVLGSNINQELIEGLHVEQPLLSDMRVVNSDVQESDGKISPLTLFHSASSSWFCVFPRYQNIREWTLRGDEIAVVIQSSTGETQAVVQFHFEKVGKELCCCFVSQEPVSLVFYDQIVWYLYTREWWSLSLLGMSLHELLRNTIVFEGTERAVDICSNNSWALTQDNLSDDDTECRDWVALQALQAGLTSNETNIVEDSLKNIPEGNSRIVALKLLAAHIKRLESKGTVKKEESGVKNVDHMGTKPLESLLDIAIRYICRIIEQYSEESELNSEAVPDLLSWLKSYREKKEAIGKVRTRVKSKRSEHRSDWQGNSLDLSSSFDSNLQKVLFASPSTGSILTDVEPESLEECVLSTAGSDANLDVFDDSRCERDITDLYVSDEEGDDVGATERKESFSQGGLFSPTAELRGIGQLSAWNEAVAHDLDLDGSELLSFSTKEIVARGLEQGKLSIALGSASGSPSGSVVDAAEWSEIRSVGRDTVDWLLSKKKISEAIQLTRLLGDRISDTLLKTSQRTMDRHLRFDLLKMLERNKVLSDEEVKQVAFLRKVEKTYPEEDFGEEYDRYLLAQRSSVDKTGDFAMEVSNYGEFSLLWTGSWTEEERTLVEIERSRSKGSLITEANRMNRAWMKVALQYFLRHEDYEMCVAWCRTLPLVSGMKYESIAANNGAGEIDTFWISSEESANDSASWTYKDVCDVISNVSTLFSEAMLELLRCECGSRGLILRDELHDPNVLLSRLCKCGLLLGQANEKAERHWWYAEPVSCIYDDVFVDLTPLLPSCSLSPFHIFVIRWCLDRDLPNLFAAYIERYCLYGCAELLEMDTSRSWFRLILLSHTPSMMYELSLANAAVALRNRKLGNIRVDTMLANRRLYMALATLAIAPVSLSDCLLASSEESWAFPLSQYRNLLKKYPMLLRIMEEVEQEAVNGDKMQDGDLALSSGEVERGNVTTVEGDSSLFNVWSYAVPFSVVDVMKGFQENGKNPALSLPYFGHPTILAMVPTEEDLDFEFFLRNGRPLEAQFWLQRQKSDSSSHAVKFSSKEMKSISSKVYQVSIESFLQDSVFRSCVVFLQLLGEDSLTLRVDTLSVRRICADPRREKANIVSMFLDLAEAKVSNGDTLQLANDILCLLEYSTERMMDSRKIPYDSPMSLVSAFCSVHGLNVYTKHLERMVQSGDWLQLIFLAACESVTPEILYEIIRVNMGDSGIREHLLCLLRIFCPSLVESSPMNSSLDNLDCLAYADDSVQARSLRFVVNVYRTVEVGTEDAVCKFLESSIKYMEPARVVFAKSIDRSITSARCLVYWLRSYSCFQNGDFHETGDDLMDLQSVLGPCASHDCSLHILNGLRIFADTHPLLPFFLCLRKWFLCEFEEAEKIFVEEFCDGWFSARGELRRYNSHSMGNDSWTVAQIHNVLNTVISQCQNSVDGLSAFEAWQLMKIACRCSEFRDTYGTMLEKGDILVECNVPISILFLEKTDVLLRIVETGEYDGARRMCAILDAEPSFVTLYEAKVVVESGDEDKWSKCESILRAHGTSELLCGLFFLFYLQKLRSDVYLVSFCNLLTRAHDHLGNESVELVTPISDVAMIAIRCYGLLFNSIIKCPHVKPSVYKAAADLAGKLELYQLIASEIEQIPWSFVAILGTLERNVVGHDLVQKEKEKFNSSLVVASVGFLLENDSLLDAKSVSEFFGVGSDMVLLASCVAQLASKEMALSDIPDEVALLAEHEIISHGGSYLLGVKESSESSVYVAHLRARLGAVAVDHTLETLSETANRISLRTHEGISVFCKRINITYAVSHVIGIPFLAAARRNPHQILETLVLMGMEYFQLARVFISLHPGRDVKSLVQILSAVLVKSVGFKEVPLSSGAAATVQAVRHSFKVQSLLEQFTGEISATPPTAGSYFPQTLHVPSPLRQGGAAAQTTETMSSFYRLHGILDSRNWSVGIFCEYSKISGDPSALGKSLLSSSKDTNLSNETKVELLIYSFWCFELAVSVEDTENVVRQVLENVPKLREADDHHLLVRFLTTIPRFGSLCSIVDILFEDGCFDLLFGKEHWRHGEAPGFQVQLMTHLNAKYSEQRDKWTLVFEKFECFHDLGEELEKQAVALLTSPLLQRMLEDGLTIRDELPQELSSGLFDVKNLFQRAAEAFMRSESFESARRCLNMAALTELQKRSKVRVMNMSQERVKDFMSSCPEFDDCLLVAECYDANTLAHWINPLQDHLVKRGEMKFLEEFMDAMPATSTLFIELSKSVRATFGETLPSSIEFNLKSAINLCEDVETVLRISKEFGWTNAVKEVNEILDIR